MVQKIQNLKVDINQNILTQLFNYIQIPNLKIYQLNINGLSKMNNSKLKNLSIKYKWIIKNE